MLSRRLEWDSPLNLISEAKAELLRSGSAILDLTESNPTRVGLDYPLEQIGQALGRAAAFPYDPDPRGIATAREALAARLSSPGDAVSPDDLLLTASTSEAYSMLFKLLCNPGEDVLTTTPSYPLLDHLARLECCRLRSFPLELDGRWALFPQAFAEALTAATRTAVIVQPNNPTGNYISRMTLEAVSALCADRAVALISDEVFFEYPLSDAVERKSAANAGEALTFTLGGLSKDAGLPHLKLGWIRLSGPEHDRREALKALEIIADSSLSVGSPVQHALDELLRIGTGVRRQILERIRANYDHLSDAIGALPAVRLLPGEGGWSAVLQVPRIEPDEALAIRILKARGVLVHPGYFFDFGREGFLVVSLLPERGVFEEGILRLTSLLAEQLDGFGR